MGGEVCCPKGSYGKLNTNYKWRGTIENVDGMNVYMSGKGTSSKVIVFIYDIFGFNSGRSRQICDELAD
jgi:dienelactone hydrolase